ncbi:TonB-dependent receptor [Pseudomaricurvus alcaniphilus]|uniref:TonB-dependent receptor plug domain-containing protein n=1 Tax=Pseudomaricurvus alcaniphilus TaxID=1166482 RepID=UPI001408E8AE|nr:TonB-dependent receptor [Pseudomaricurvus alcaniphilus]NHN36269.1 TonB-dependent receptor [Pseudomaricurvus alcaniphilus]
MLISDRRIQVVTLLWQLYKSRRLALQGGASWSRCRVHTKLAMLLFSLSATVSAGEFDYSTRDLLDLSLEELASLEISSVSKKPEKLSSVAASVFVITADDIRRSGAVSLPEALRLAPNLQVARIDASRYAISARGFNSTAANKLQVLIDGRIAYTPLFSGVFWDAQDVVLADVERIEVVSGPAAVIWGSNAVNGVINVITRGAAASRGDLLVLGAGNLEQQLVVRHGGALAAGGDYRVYAKLFNGEESQFADGAAAGDDWHRAQLGFRVDMEVAGQLTLQGDVYDGREQQLDADNIEIQGVNLLSRWQSELENNSRLQLQAYYDHTERDQPGVFAETLDILDLELQQQIELGAAHDIVWGVNYRAAWDDVSSSPVLAFLPARRKLEWSSLFVRDEISLQENLRLSLGVRLEYNTYTHLEVMPNVRLAWEVTADNLLWASAAQALRSPSRLDRDAFAPREDPRLLGGPEFESERLNSVEAGYRGLLLPNLTCSVTAFYHQYDDIRSLEPVGSGQLVFANGLEADSYGLEFWGEYQPRAHWRLSAGGTLLREDVRMKAGSADLNGGRGEVNDPSHQWFLRSSMDLGDNFQLDLSLRHVAQLATFAVPAYNSFDANFAWYPTDGTRVSLSMRNLFDSQRPEFGNAVMRSEIERSVYVQLSQKF